MSTESKIKSLALKYFDQVGFAAAQTPPTLEIYENWLKGGLHGDMGYLWRHLEKKRNPDLLLAGAKTWIALTLNYDTQEPLSIEQRDLFSRDKKGWIARYARGRDYHDEIAKRHERLITELQSFLGSHSFLSCVDAQAVLERDVAARAGLGWIGKNTCLIDRDRGSFLFLSEILTTLDLIPDRPVMDHCGTCTRCLDACPTGALEDPRRLNATKCISYWTIEAKQAAPPELASRFGWNFFGCDICQDVCPWNTRARKHRPLPVPGESGIVDLCEILNRSDQELKDHMKDRALSRAKPGHLKRNAALVMTNHDSGADFLVISKPAGNDPGGKVL